MNGPLDQLAIGIGVFGIVMLALCLNDRRLRWLVLLVLIGMVLAMAGCNATPERPATPPAPIVCAAPVGMTGQAPEPDRPQGEYMQRDVALYLSELHGWGKRGWKALAAVRRHASRCIDDHTSDEPRE
ncbi:MULTISPECIES: hypothetical protein [Halomonas]|uniref:Lipoprotein n=1 Tax=Halomonas halophila TaxID=29573 RepID=A0ABQ0TZB1_9GAMM|nr:MULTISPECIES: hypothetical protein [Halomonas]MDR5889650.1 hypothetical protein [Halomonas salina]WJY06332.1 hypothetical protein QWG60_11500 [Halomonas halophila]GEK71581.1 hypothetical protein HHA04nite_01250 [Halomonas halophila]